MPPPTFQPIPRLLLGAALLFWGSMIGFPVVGLITALIIESPHWIRSRWNFNDTACSRAVQLSITFSVITAAAIWFDGHRYTALAKLLIWLPLLLFPIQFVQSFGFNNYLNLKAFYLFLNKYNKFISDTTERESIVRFNFGSVYFIAIMVASSLGSASKHVIFFPGVILLSAWLIFSYSKTRYVALCALLLLGSGIGIVGQIGMSELYEWATSRGLSVSAPTSASPTTSRTNIGSLGEIKQSSKIQWRLYPKEKQAAPRLIRTASYNRYKGITWRNVYPEPGMSDEESYRELGSLNLTDGDLLSEKESYFLLRENMTREDLIIKLPEFEIRGAIAADATLPLPGNASSLQNLEFNDISINPMGTVRSITEKPITVSRVRWNDPISTEAPPYPIEDLAIDPVEYDGIHEVATALGLKKLKTTQQKLNRLRQFFQKEFSYSRYLSIQRIHSSRQRPTAIEIFLTTNRSGHCEYFATAATLLLRAADVPARYSIGFSVMEKHPRKNEWIARGTHAHAWTRVWDEQGDRWIDFDPTPNNWLQQETRIQSKYQGLTDSLQRIKEDFFLWRNEPNNRLGILIGLSALGLLLLLYIVHRLRKSRIVLQRQNPSSSHLSSNFKTPLHDLEKLARKHLPPRRPGETLVTWLMHLKAHQISESDLHLACQLHQQLRFDPTMPDSKIVSELTKLVAKLHRQLKKT